MSRLKNNVSTIEEDIEPTFQESSNSKSNAKALLNKFIEEETKLVKGKFRNLESPGGSVKIAVRKYPGIPMFEKVMEDGRMYEIPLYVARHLNGTDVTAAKAGKKINTCAYPTHGFKCDNSGELPRSQEDGGMVVPIIGPVKWNRRYAFESMEFDAGDE